MLFTMGLNITTTNAQDYQFPEIDLSLSSAMLFALNKNPDIEAALEKYIQTKADIDNDKAALYPTLSSSVLVGQQYNNPSSTNNKSATNAYAEASLVLEQILFDGFETINNINRRKDLSQAAYWSSRNQIDNIMRETAQYYLDILAYQQRVILAQDLYQDIADNLAYVQAQYDAGAADKVILDYANSRLSAAETDLNRARSSLNDSISNLEFLTGRLPPNFNTSYPERLNPEKLDLEYYLELSKKGNSRIIAGDYQVSAFKHQLEAQKGRDKPLVALVINGEQSHNSGGEKQGLTRTLKSYISVDYTLFDGHKRKAVKSRMKSQISQSEIEKEQTIKEVQRDIKQAYNTIKSNMQSIKAKDVEIRSSTALKALNEENFKLGNINIIELIESAERLSDAKVQRIALLNEMYLDTYNLLILSSMINNNFFCETCEPMPTH